MGKKIGLLVQGNSVDSTFVLKGFLSESGYEVVLLRIGEAIIRVPPFVDALVVYGVADWAFHWIAGFRSGRPDTPVVYFWVGNRPRPSDDPGVVALDFNSVSLSSALREALKKLLPG